MKKQIFASSSKRINAVFLEKNAGEYMKREITLIAQILKTKKKLSVMSVIVCSKQET